MLYFETHKSTSSESSEHSQSTTPDKHTSMSTIGLNENNTQCLIPDRASPSEQFTLFAPQSNAIGGEAYRATAPSFIEYQDKQRFFALHYD